MRQSKLTKKLLFWIPASAGIVLQIFFLACTKERRHILADNSAVSASGPATLSTIHEDIFRLGCSTSGCHDNRATPAASLNLSSADQSYNGMVNQFSLQSSQLKMVDPGSANQSYLINKLRGTHLSVGGTGDRMPQYAAALTEGDLQRIEDWITAGALRN
jgi:hypothetical protein